MKPNFLCTSNLILRRFCLMVGYVYGYDLTSMYFKLYLLEAT